MQKILLRNIDVPDLKTLPVYRSLGGYRSWQKVVESMKPAELIDEVKASGLQRPRRRGVSYRHEVELCPERQPKAQIPRLQRGRKRAGHFQRSLADRARSPCDHRRDFDFSFRDSVPHGLYLYSRRDGLRRNVLERAVEEAIEPVFIGRNIFGSGYDLDLIVHQWRGRLYLRRGNRVAVVIGRQPRLA